MDLNDSFEVSHAIDTVWSVLTDVEKIAPCLPGACLTGTDGEQFLGVVKVKVGPVTSQYKGKAKFSELDEDAHRLVLSASGRDTRGAGNASAKITVQLDSLGEASTRVNVSTKLTITGKVAQFGRGVMGDVSRKLMGQFAKNLATLIDEQQTDTSSDEPPADVQSEAPPPSASSADSSSNAAQAQGSSSASQSAPAAPASAASAPASGDDDAVDLLAVAGGSVMKRVVPVLVVGVIIVIIVIVAAA